jgi:hypothetical protein
MLAEQSPNFTNLPFVIANISLIFRPGKSFQDGGVFLPNILARRLVANACRAHLHRDRLEAKELS